MAKVRWDAKADFEYVQNYKVLQDCFNKVGISKKIPVQLLIRGKYQDNLEFMQWLKRFFELNDSGDDYSAVDRRSRGKGGKTFIGNGKVQKKTTSREKRDKFNARAGAKSKSATTTTTTAAAAAAAANKPVTAAAGSKIAEEKENNQQNRRSSSTRTAARSTAQRSTTQRRRPSGSGATTTNSSNAEVSALRSKVSGLTSDKEGLQKDFASLQLTVDGLEKERDFYFGKLRDIEILLQSVEDEDSGKLSPADQLKLLIERGLKILYATGEGEDFVAVTELVDATEPEAQQVSAAAPTAAEVVVPPSPVQEEEEEEEEEVVTEQESLPVVEGKEGAVETF